MAIKLTKVDAEKLRVGLQEAFDASDVDGSRKIDINEFERVLQSYNASDECVKKLSDNEIREIAKEFIRDADKSGDGTVSFNEFHKYMLQSLGIQE